jgi:hypothetical protein
MEMSDDACWDVGNIWYGKCKDTMSQLQTKTIAYCSISNVIKDFIESDTISQLQTRTFSYCSISKVVNDFIESDTISQLQTRTFAFCSISNVL